MVRSGSAVKVRPLPHGRSVDTDDGCTECHHALCVDLRGAQSIKSSARQGRHSDMLRTRWPEPATLRNRFVAKP
jgi:hypothetical protein